VSKRMHEEGQTRAKGAAQTEGERIEMKRKHRLHTTTVNRGRAYGETMKARDHWACTNQWFAKEKRDCLPDVGCGGRSDRHELCDGEV